ncbi:hypothetical protein BGZ47_001459, partial [Haplosporangium gracile]
MKFTSAIIALSAVAALVKAGTLPPLPSGQAIVQEVKNTVGGATPLKRGLFDIANLPNGIR